MSAPVTQWFNRLEHPSRKGLYEVRNREPRDGRHKDKLIGSPFRYWNGFRWLTEKGGHVSIFAKHLGHEWRGLADKPATPPESKP